MAVHYQWDKVKEDARILAKALPGEDIDAIVAVTRGGLFIAGLLSYLLDKRYVYTYGIKTYEGKEAGCSKTLFDPPITRDNKRILIVDDLVDKGFTMRHIKDDYPNAITAALYVDPSSFDLVDYYAAEKPHQWIIFPWDYGED